MDSKNSKKKGKLFLRILTVLFIVLKLCGVINWAWVWVLSPLWMPVAIIMIPVIISFVFVAIANVILRFQNENEDLQNKNQKHTKRLRDIINKFVKSKKNESEHNKASTIILSKDDYIVKDLENVQKPNISKQKEDLEKLKEELLNSEKHDKAKGFQYKYKKSN